MLEVPSFCYQTALKTIPICHFSGSRAEKNGERIILLIPTRSWRINLKQICLWDLARIIFIAFIIQTAQAIWFFVAILLPLILQIELCCYIFINYTNLYVSKVASMIAVIVLISIEIELIRSTVVSAFVARQTSSAKILTLDAFKTLLILFLIKAP